MQHVHVSVWHRIERQVVTRLRPLVCSIRGHKPTERQDELGGVVHQCARCEKELTPGEIPEGEPPNTTALALREIVVVGDQMYLGARLQVPIVQIRTHAKHITVSRKLGDARN